MPLPQGHAAGLHEIGSTTHCLLLFLVSPLLTCSSCPPGPTGDRGHRLKRLVLRPHGVHPASLPAVPSIFLPKAYRHRWPRLPAEARRPRPVHSRRRGKERSGKSQSSSGSAGSRSQGRRQPRQLGQLAGPGDRAQQGRAAVGRPWGGPGRPSWCGPRARQNGPAGQVCAPQSPAAFYCVSTLQTLLAFSLHTIAHIAASCRWHTPLPHVGLNRSRAPDPCGGGAFGGGRNGRDNGCVRRACQDAHTHSAGEAQTGPLPPTTSQHASQLFSATPAPLSQTQGPLFAPQLMEIGGVSRAKAVELLARSHGGGAVGQHAPAPMPCTHAECGARAHHTLLILWSFADLVGCRWSVRWTCSSPDSRSAPSSVGVNRPI